MARAGEHGHVPAGFGPQDFCRAPVHSGNGIEPSDLLIKRAQSLLDLVAEPFDSSLQIINLRQMLRDQKALMRFKPARERLHQLLRQPPAKSSVSKCRVHLVT